MPPSDKPTLYGASFALDHERSMLRIMALGALYNEQYGGYGRLQVFCESRREYHAAWTSANDVIGDRTHVKAATLSWVLQGLTRRLEQLTTEDESPDTSPETGMTAGEP